jgi:hypothetical protein
MRQEGCDVNSRSALATETWRHAQGGAPTRGERLWSALGSVWGQTALALAIGLAFRLWLVAGSHGMMDGDEASLSIAAEYILRGQFPVYYPGVNYDGAWDAYLLAPLVALFGPSAWATRAVTGAQSLALIPVMGALAARLFGERARLPALLLTALPPVYVQVIELRMLGGYVETMLIGSLLTLLALSVADHWREGRPIRWQWALAGLLIGLGLWISPLLVAYVLGVAVWLVPLALTRMRYSWRQSRRETLAGLARAGAPALITFVLGAAPMLFSPQTYAGGNPIFPGASSATGQGEAGVATGVMALLAHGWRARLHFGAYFLTTALPEAVGARLAYPPLAHNALGLALGLVGGLIVVGGIATLLAGVGWPLPLAPLVRDRARWNAALPVVLAGVILGGYLARKSLDPGVMFIDEARHLLALTTPLTLALAYAYTVVSQRDTWSGGVQRLARRIWPRERAGAVIAAALLLMTLMTYGAQGLLSDPVMAFNSPYNNSARLPGGVFPAEDTELLTYLDAHHIRYVWVNHWVGNVVMYLSDQRTLCSDYVDVVYYHSIDRFPQATVAVARADRPSYIVAWSGPEPPPLAGALDKLGVRYTSARFGRFWVYTPITRTVNPQEVLSALVEAYW